MTGVIGINNAGKSALIKFFYEARPLFELVSGAGNFKSVLRGEQTVTFAGVADPDEIFSNQNTMDMTLVFRLINDPADPNREVPVPDELVFTVARGSRALRLEVRGEREMPRPGRLSWSETRVVGTTSGNPPIYELGPWFELFQALRKSLYVGPFRNAIQVGSGQHYDLPIGQAFVAQWDRYRAGPIKSETDAALELTEQIRSIFGFERLDIAASSGNDTLQVIIDDKSYRLDEVGAGLAHFVMVLAVAAIQKPSFIFIDEPELNLHASLQLSFLSALGSYAEHGVMFATHSLGLARAVGTPLYSARRIRSGQAQLRVLEDTPELGEFLGELGLSGYQELGYDKVLLVEGPTDVLAIQQLLRLHRADHKIVLLPLGGSAMIHGGVAQQLQEVTRLSKNVSALVDSDREKAGDKPVERIAAFAKVCGKLGIACHILERRALENYFTDRAVKAAKGDAFRALAEFEARGAMAPSWGKDENWRVARELTMSELEATDLGRFLASLV